MWRWIIRVVVSLLREVCTLPNTIEVLKCKVIEGLGGGMAFESNFKDEFNQEEKGRRVRPRGRRSGGILGTVMEHRD